MNAILSLQKETIHRLSGFGVTAGLAPLGGQPNAAMGAHDQQAKSSLSGHLTTIFGN